MKRQKKTDGFCTGMMEYHTLRLNEINWFMACSLWFVCLFVFFFLSLTKMMLPKGVASKTRHGVLADMAVGESHSAYLVLCWGSFQITDSWFGRFFSLWCAAPPFPALWEDWVRERDFRVGGNMMERRLGPAPAFLLLLSAAKTTNPGLPCPQPATVLLVCISCMRKCVCVVKGRAVVGAV